MFNELLFNVLSMTSYLVASTRDAFQHFAKTVLSVDEPLVGNRYNYNMSFYLLLDEH